jgi:hypothetical protein
MAKDKLQGCKDIAQRDANKTGNSYAVLNLNRFNPLYVVRLYKENMEFAPDFVAVFHPQKES